MSTKMSTEIPSEISGEIIDKISSMSLNGPSSPPVKNDNYYTVTDPDGTISWYKNGRLHRDCDLPAVVDTAWGIMVWYQNGLLHRDNDLPAYIDSDGIKAWYYYGKLYRHTYV